MGRIEKTFVFDSPFTEADYRLQRHAKTKPRDTYSRMNCKQGPYTSRYSLANDLSFSINQKQIRGMTRVCLRRNECAKRILFWRDKSGI